VLTPGQRLIETAGALHVYDGRRLVSLSTDAELSSAIVAATNAPSNDEAHQAAVAAGLDYDTAGQLLDVLQALALLADYRDVEREPSTSAAQPDDPQQVAAGFVASIAADRPGVSAIRQRLAGIEVIAVGARSDALAASLGSSGLAARPGSLDGLADLDPTRAIVIAEPDEHRPELLATVNEACLRHGVSWLPIGQFDGDVIRVGPLVIPGETACLECTLNRLASNVEFATEYRTVAGLAPAAPAPTSIRDWARATAAIVLLRWIGGREANVPGTLFTLAPREMSIRPATVLRVPRCAACSAADYVASAAPWQVDNADS
jgi:bacteriocin biosynthesis cyclodehydratase domain-containing protein